MKPGPPSSTGERLDPDLLAPGSEGRKKAGEIGAQGSRPEAAGCDRRRPFATPPRYEEIVGALAGCYSRRINIQHRLVYEVVADEHVVHVLRMWTHYE
ncbi:MAG: Txe/YoeB family addiction module toxin [Intrasporangium sp.]|uniref:Txe/YoeB family addiction module toxin n=1 Tax=Intrasporangium sp. TaxID=1925024 RepID=UPI002649EC2F|nr:Txe/YoeB family addiction module toxin [Intrasporangium sp.]MDN5794401.1 Txe/YoeB family addiction module toxin [Intrasporangium sp.]